MTCKYNRLGNTINHYKYFCVYFHLLKMLCTIELKQLHSFLLHPVAKLLVHDIKKLTHFPSYTHKNVHTMHTHAHTIDLHTHTHIHPSPSSIVKVWALHYCCVQCKGTIIITIYTKVYFLSASISFFIAASWL